jgi:putative hemolysin
LESNPIIDQLHPVFSFIFLAATTQSTTILFVTLVLLLILGFVISGGEVALFSLENKDVNMLKTKNHPAAKRIINLLEEPKEVYASLLIAGTFINICVIVLANYLVDLFISFSNWPMIITVLIKVLLIAFILVFFGKILPKVWATQNNLRFAYGSSYTLEALHLLLKKISRRVVSLADGIGKRFGAHRGASMSAQELDAAIDIKPDDEASPEEKNIMKGIVKFGNISVKQIMRSRLDVSGVDHALTFTSLVKRVEELHYSRLPVYKGSLDEVAGILYTKDILPYLQEPDNYNWHHLLRQPYFVPESKAIEDLLKDFQQKRTHFAVVVDEFGGTSGIVTMEDVLEEIIGDIKDEFDEEEIGVKRIDNNTYIFEGKTMIHDLCKAMRLPADSFDQIKGESDSLAGLVLELSGEFPATNTMIPWHEFEFTVLQTEHNRIKQVKVSVQKSKLKS